MVSQVISSQHKEKKKLAASNGIYHQLSGFKFKPSYQGRNNLVPGK